MKKLLIAVYFLSIIALSSLPSLAECRNVYLNGVDISSTKSQALKNVNISIGEDGSIFIEAPHYQVNEESTYTPISKHAKKKLEARAGDSNLLNNDPTRIEIDPPVVSPSPENKALREKAGIKLEN